MIEPLRDPTYRRLFGAQVIALLGTGLATVGLALLAYDLAGPDAGAVLGTALGIKMLAYVGVAPFAGALAERLPRRRLLVALDVLRLLVALLLPFVDQVWQVYLLIFVLQAASAAFTPSFQATIPDVLPEEGAYTRALSLSRLAYDLENLISPALAAAALALVSFHWLFAGTAAGFAVSAALVLSTRLPQPVRDEQAQGFLERTTKGLRIYMATPRLKGLLALNLVAAAAGAMVIVNTVVVVREVLGGGDGDVALAHAVFGAGSMAAALALPRLLDTRADRLVMLAGAALLVVALPLLALAFALGAGWPAMLAGWLLLGLGYSTVLTPSGRLLRRSSAAEDRPSVFAAQFALSHACWLLTYPLAGWLGAAAGLAAASLGLAVPALLGLLAAFRLWPARDPEVLAHVHPDLPADHPHVRGAEPSVAGPRHAHPFAIDALHRQWPTQG